MDTEHLAWTAFKLCGSVDAYLLHKSIEKIYKNTENCNGNNKGTDNKTI